MPVNKKHGERNMKQALILSLILLAACGHIGPTYASNEQGNVTIYLRGNSNNLVAVSKVRCNMSQGEFATTTINDNDSIKVSMGMGGAIGSGRINVKPGDFVRIEARQNLFVVNYILTKMPPEVAKNELIGTTKATCLRRS